tara:strand:+ start:312 stop:2249 length:1938 start_codon:yes stop_codon:yes gene_type:complete
MTLRKLISLFFPFIFLFFVDVSFSENKIDTDIFGSPPLISRVSVSPSGNKIALFANLEDGSSTIFVRDLQNNKLIPVVSSDNKFMKLRSFSWFNEEIILAKVWFSEKMYRTMLDNFGLLKINADGSGFESMFQKKHFKKLYRPPLYQDQIIDWLEDDPDHILVNIRTTIDRYPDVVKVNVHKRELSLAKRAKTDVGSWKTDRFGRVRIGRAYNPDKEKENSVLFYDLQSEKWRTVLEFAEFSEDEINILGFGEDANEVWFLAYEDGRKAVFRADFSKNALQPKLVFADPSRDVQGGLRYKKGSKDPIGIYFWDENNRLITWDKESFEFEKSVYDRFPDKEVYFISESKDGNRYVIFVENSSTPGVFYLGDKTLGTFDLVSEAYPSLRNVTLPAKEVINYQARDGLEIEAYLTKPQNKSTNLPTIIFPHGGPIAADSKQGFDYWTSFFANRGYAVLQMNFRGSTGYGYDFMKAGLGKWGLEMQYDVEDATKWIVNEGVADPNRICIVGGSYGGYAALMGVATSDLYQCAVSFAGVTDLGQLLKNSRMFTNGKMVRQMLGDNRSKLMQTSPVTLANQIKVPVLLVHGEDDSRVPIKHGKRMRDAMKKAGVNFNYIQQKNSDHFLTLKANRLQFFKETEKFLEKHIGN